MSNNAPHTFQSIPALLSDILMCTVLVVSGCYANAVHSQEPDAVATAASNELRFTIGNIRSTDGPLMIQVMASEAAFKGEAPSAASLVVPAKEGGVTVHIDPFPAGEYAIRVMQDLDNDGELKTNLVGMPKEPWGMSNNAAGSFGPPKWRDAKFTVPATAPQAIDLR